MQTCKLVSLRSQLFFAVGEASCMRLKLGMMPSGDFGIDDEISGICEWMEICCVEGWEQRFQ